MTDPSEWWHRLPLAALSPDQWEALCDGCARCCLHKLVDSDSGTLHYTRVHCRYLDPQGCRCRHYRQRFSLQPECVRLDPAALENCDWLPPTCAYRLRAQGQRLPDWHPLVSGDAGSVHRAGISVRGRVVSEQHVHPDGYDEHLVHWVEADPAGSASAGETPSC